MSAVESGMRPTLGTGMRLQWEAAQDAFVLLYPEGMVKLNGSAAAIMTRCDGARTVEEIIADLEQSYGASGLENEVRAFIAVAVRQQWLQAAT